MSQIDHTIARDLAALGENSRRDIPALDEALRTTDAYRDDRPGAEARRNALAEERRRELVLMPLTLAHVFAHRLGRAAAGGMAVLCSLVLVAMLVDPLLLRFAAWAVPGLSVGMLATIAALAIIAAYVVASWIGEAWFARKMRAAIQTGDDAYRDLDHLARGPLEIAQAAVHKVDGWSFGLFLAGAASITLAFGYVVVLVGMQHTISTAWSLSALYDSGIVQRNIDFVVLAIAACGGTSVLLVRNAAVAKALGSWMALVVAAVVGITTMYQGVHLLLTWRRDWPSLELRTALALGATITVFLPMAWALLFWRRREQQRIGID